MGSSSLQAKIDSITWYHHFDFGNGLKTTDSSPDAESHHRLFDFIEKQLDAIPFRGKSVLDIGCWDGYWSFYAEKRGAASVLATDDFSQNWSNAKGIFLAKELLGSRVEIKPQLSVYDLAKLDRRFDIVLFLGVYYHLWDPFLALSQIRHCCHPGSVVLIDGTYDPFLPPYACYFASKEVPTSKFTPSIEGLDELLAATYFRLVSQHDVDSSEAAGSSQPAGFKWRWRLRLCLEALKGSHAGVKEMSEMLFPPNGVRRKPCSPGTPGQTVALDVLFPPRAFRRTLLVCKPFEGENEKHLYVPPFGLHQYDIRFNAPHRSAA